MIQKTCSTISTDKIYYIYIKAKGSFPTRVFPR